MAWDDLDEMEMNEEKQLVIDAITIFPRMFEAVLGESIVKRAQEKNLLSVNVHDLRKWTNDSHKTVDDKPYGGGPGMVMMIEPVYQALQEIKGERNVGKGEAPGSTVILMSAAGKKFAQPMAESFSKETRLILICPHYEGIDQRVVDHLVDVELSIGDYVLTGGEIPAMVVIDAVTRLIPGVLGKDESTEMESHSNVKVNNVETEVLEYPQYTRPEKFVPANDGSGGSRESWDVPEVLLGGNHEDIKQWRIANLKVAK